MLSHALWRCNYGSKNVTKEQFNTHTHRHRLLFNHKKQFPLTICFNVIFISYLYATLCLSSILYAIDGNSILISKCWNGKNLKKKIWKKITIILLVRGNKLNLKSLQHSSYTNDLRCVAQGEKVLLASFHISSLEVKQLIFIDFKLRTLNVCVCVCV